MKIFKLFILIITLLVLFVAVEIYPFPRAIWKQWHRKEFAALENISQLLKAQEIVYSNFQCSTEGFPSNCAIIFAFTTEIGKDEFNKIMFNLIGQNAFPVENHEDGHSIYSLLDIDANKTITVKGTAYYPLTTQEPMSVSYYPENSSVIHNNLSNKIDITLFETKELGLEIDNVPTKLNAVIFTYMLDEIGI